MASHRQKNRVSGHVAARGAAAAALCVLAGAPAIAASVPTLATEIPAPVASHSAVFLGAAAPDAPMHLVISLPQRNAAALNAFLRDIYDPRSPNFRHYLSVAAFTAQFGPTAADYATAFKFFADRGLIIEAQAPNRFLIDVGGSVSDIERVFHVTMGMYRHPTENRAFIAPDRQPALDLAVPVQQVIGLDDFVRPYTKLVHASQEATGTGSGPGGDFTGSDMRTAYYPKGKLTGAGQSIGLMELGGYNIADVQNFFAQGYGPANTVDIVGVKTDRLSLSCTGKCDDGEQALDIEYAISIAPGLSSVRVYVGKSPEDVLNRMATDNISKILSTSWGWGKNFATDDALFKEFAAQGQTNLTASGDNSLAQGERPLAGRGCQHRGRWRHRCVHVQGRWRLVGRNRMAGQRRRPFRRQGHQDRKLPASLHHQSQQGLQKTAQRAGRRRERGYRHVYLRGRVMRRRRGRHQLRLADVGGHYRVGQPGG